MKVLVLLFLVSAASASWLPHLYQNDDAVSDAQKQLDVLHLLNKVYEPIRNYHVKLYEASQKYNPKDHLSNFKENGKAVLQLTKELEDKRILEKKEIFSLFNDRHREEAIMLFHVLIASKDWETFISSAAYFRERVNEGVFVYAIYTAIIHSDLSTKLTLPPLYEITPHMFTNSEIIDKAYTAKMTQSEGKFVMNFTGSKKNPEQRVAYFGEDIGMNVHHVTWHMDYPFWWKSHDDDHHHHHLDRKGELFFWVHHQLTVRFDAERLSNNLNVVDELHWDKPIKNGFAPHTTYKYGGDFPARHDNVNFKDVDGVASIRDVKAFENRIRDAIAHGYIIDKSGKHIDIRNEKGIETIGNILESSEDSVNVPYYGALHNLAHIILGRQGDPHGKFDLPPGVMEHFETATRDPAFFRLHKYIDQIFKEHKDSFAPYTKSDVEFPDVAIKSVKIDGQLETYFEDFEFNLLMAVDDTPSIPDVGISAVVKRINHKPFTFTLDVANNNNEKILATVRIYLCPTKDGNGIPFTLNEKRWNCIEIDKFWKHLNPGVNHIERKSTSASTTVPDHSSYDELVNIAKQGIKSGSLPNFPRICGIPNRFLLPKGKPEGMEFTLIVAVTDGKEDYNGSEEDLPDEEHGETHAHCGIHGEAYPDKRPLGFPLDRQIPDERIVLELPNVHHHIVTVTHTGEKSN